MRHLARVGAAALLVMVAAVAMACVGWHRHDLGDTPGGDGARGGGEVGEGWRGEALGATERGVGPAAFDWTIRTLDGALVPFDAFRGRVVFLNVWASWCPPCVAELASIGRLRDALAGSDVAFVLVSPENPAPVRRFLSAYGYGGLPVYLERDPIPEAYGLKALPTTYILDRNGAIVLRHRGAADWDRPEVRAFLRSLTR